MDPLRLQLRGTQPSPAPFPLTFVEGPSREHIPAVGEAGPAGTERFVLAGAGAGTLLAVRAPGRAHGAAAHVHAEFARQRLRALVLVPAHVALLHPHVWGGAQRASAPPARSHSSRSLGQAGGALGCGVFSKQRPCGWGKVFLGGIPRLATEPQRRDPQGVTEFRLEKSFEIQQVSQQHFVT